MMKGLRGSEAIGPPLSRRINFMLPITLSSTAAIDMLASRNVQS